MELTPIPPARLILEGGISLKEGTELHLGVSYDGHFGELDLALVLARGSEILEFPVSGSMNIEELADSEGGAEILPLARIRTDGCSFEQALEREFAPIVVTSAHFGIAPSEDGDDWHPEGWVAFRIRTEFGCDETEYCARDLCEPFLNLPPLAP